MDWVLGIGKTMIQHEQPAFQKKVIFDEGDWNSTQMKKKWMIVKIF